MFLGVAGNQDIPFGPKTSLEPSWRVFDVLISWLSVLQKPTNPQRKQAFYSRFLQNIKNDIRCFRELAVKGGIQDSF
jgi:hypothetical protein